MKQGWGGLSVRVHVPVLVDAAAGSKPGESVTLFSEGRQGKHYSSVAACRQSKSRRYMMRLRPPG